MHFFLCTFVSWSIIIHCPLLLLQIKFHWKSAVKESTGVDFKKYVKYRQVMRSEAL